MEIEDTDFKTLYVDIKQMAQWLKYIDPDKFQNIIC